jgi:tetratricopeptide (TPR) repeat protein
MSASIQPKRMGPARKTPLKMRDAPVAVAAAAAAPAEEVLDRHQLCVEILVEGFVQSYVDFFYLTHRPDPHPDPNDETAEREIDVPAEEMLFIRDNLTRAESARRHGETATVYDCYNNLARYFQNIDDCKTGIYFHEKCLEIARLTQDKLGEMRANHSLGLAHQSIKSTASAIMYHERHLTLATEAAHADEQKGANAELLHVYRKAAEELEATNDFGGAIAFHEKCLASSTVAGERGSEGKANYAIGCAYVVLKEARRAVSFLNAYLKICKELEDLEGEGKACSALAAAYQALAAAGDDGAEGGGAEGGGEAASVANLQRFLDIATKTDDLIAQGQACCNLAVICNKQGDFAKAVEYFEQNFDVARQTVAAGKGDRSLLDTARINLGVARGNAQMKAYIGVINYDISALLRWKNRRVKFT